MNTTTTPAIQNITDLCNVLMNAPCRFDMSTIEPAVTVVMQETGIKFRPYMAVLAENYEGYKQTAYEQTEEYFFARLNSLDMTEGKILNLVKLCIE